MLESEALAEATHLPTMNETDISIGQRAGPATLEEFPLSIDGVAEPVMGSPGDFVSTGELIMCHEELPPFNFGPHGADYFLSKFTWASQGMPALLKYLAVSITAEDHAIMRRARSLEMEYDDSGEDLQPFPMNRKSTINESMNRQKAAGASKPPKNYYAASRNSIQGVPKQPPPPPPSQPSLPHGNHQMPAGVTNPGKRFPSAKPNIRPPAMAAAPAALKPIRRLAKVRPYANQAIPVSMEEIYRSIPKDASAVFHVLDRRINLDAFAPVTTKDWDVSVPVYSLLRAWVQDDPCRQVPAHQLLLTATVARQLKADPPNPAVSSPASALLHGHKYDAGKRKRKPHADVIGSLAKLRDIGSAIPLEVLRKELIRVTPKKRRRLATKRDFAQVMKRLQEG